MYFSMYSSTQWTDGFLLISYLVAAAILQCLWSLLLAFVDIYALLVKRSLRNARAVCIFTIGDGVSNIISFYPVKKLCFVEYITLLYFFHSFDYSSILWIFVLAQIDRHTSHTFDDRCRGSLFTLLN